ncbi:MAG: trypsin-like peptidase domain-containing protein [Clostridia bacterium]|nr:trypsin-like peptidase domain-containing protein [Clostridia bacterium]
MDYPNDSMNNDKQQENASEYVDGISTQPYVDRVYEPVKTAADGTMPEYTAHNVSYSEPVKPAKKQRHGVTALVLVLCMVASLIFGFGGGVAAMTLLDEAPQQSAPQQQDVQTQQEQEPAYENAAPLSQIARDEENLRSVPEVVAGVADSVVEITTESVVNSVYIEQYVTEGAGSGVIVSSDGMILTCHHVIEDATKVTVRLRSGEQYEAQVIASDNMSDVAILKIDATGLNAAPIGDSDALLVGEETVVIGNPLGSLGGTVSNGIISALEREIVIGGERMTLLQTNAAISPGNSGGGIFDMYGNLIGIVVAKSAGSGVEGLGFAIPINYVMEVYDELQTNGYVTGRAALGVALSEQTAMSFGGESRAYVVVTQVIEDSPAQAAGIQMGDIILYVDELEVTSAQSVVDYIRQKSVGDTVQLQLLRGNRTVSVTAVLAESKPAQ